MAEVEESSAGVVETPNTDEKSEESDIPTFPDRPYMSVNEAIKAKDVEAIMPFIKARNFDPNTQTLPNNKRFLTKEWAH